MTKLDFVSHLLQLDCSSLSKGEKILIEIKLFTIIYEELLKTFKYPYKDYLALIKYDPQEETMFYINFIQEIIKDILSTEEYSLSGIAIYTHTPEEVLLDIASGMNTNPTFELARKLFALHVILRRDLYDTIMEKIISEYLSRSNQVKEGHI